MSALRPSPLRVAGWVAGSFAAAVVFRRAQGDSATSTEQPKSIVSELDKASQETTGTIWFGDEKENGSTVCTK